VERRLDGSGVMEDGASASAERLEAVEELKMAQAVPRASAERGYAETSDFRIASLGNVDSGKSTLVGCLTRGLLDDGRGKVSCFWFCVRVHVMRERAILTMRIV